MPATLARKSRDLSVQNIEVYLALPHYLSSSRNVIDAEHSRPRPTRYIKEEIAVFDENSGENERQVEVVRPNLQVLFDGKAVSGTDHIQIARLRQENAGTYVLDDSYIPPSLHISASPTIVAVIRRLLETLHSKSASLSESRGLRTAGMLEFSGSEVSNLWLLQTVNSAIPVLDHYYRNRRVHPETVFISLARLAGALLAFSPSVQPRDLPHYDHNDLS